MKMKKKYINPTVEVMVFKPTTLLTNSVTIVDGLDNVTFGEDEFEGGTVDAPDFLNADF